MGYSPRDRKESDTTERLSSLQVYKEESVSFSHSAISHVIVSLLIS